MTDIKITDADRQAAEAVLGEMMMGNAHRAERAVARHRHAAMIEGARLGIEAAAKKGAQVILDARMGEIDNDLRCIGYILNTDIHALDPLQIIKDATDAE